jgi:hypothetical protein
MYSDKKEITNIFKTGTVKLGVTECFCEPKNWNPEDCTEKIVTICNEGTKAIYVRVKFEPRWECGLSTQNVHYEPTDHNWVKIGCYYYYKYILGSCLEVACNPKCVTLKLCVKLAGCSGNEYQGKTFELSVKVDAIQAKNNHEVICEWNLNEHDMWAIGFEPYPYKPHDNECCREVCEPCKKPVPCEPCEEERHCEEEERPEPKKSVKKTIKNYFF